MSICYGERTCHFDFDRPETISIPPASFEYLDRRFQAEFFNPATEEIGLFIARVTSSSDGPDSLEQPPTAIASVNSRTYVANTLVLIFIFPFDY
jgi:hypothetical protein